MSMGSRTGSRRARAARHTASPQSYVPDATTREAVSGGSSMANAKGSVLTRNAWVGVRISYLYRAPGRTPGTNSSNTPDAPSDRMGNTRPSQALKSPITLTRRIRRPHRERGTGDAIDGAHVRAERLPEAAV